MNPTKVALGEGLYNDKRLSGDGALPAPRATPWRRGAPTSPVLRRHPRPEGRHQLADHVQLGLRFAQFWDGRAATLDEQAGGPLANPIEMGSTWPPWWRLSGDTPSSARARPCTRTAQPGHFTDAIAAFERSLLTPNSRFDNTAGAADALSAEEKRGHEVFRAGCATCHVGELLGGKSFEVMGLRADYFEARGGKLTDADHGRYNVTKDEKDRHAFKVPTLRNVARTFPYFHDGSKETLREAVDAMARTRRGEALGEKDAQTS